MSDRELLKEMREYAKAEWIPILREDSEEFLVKILKEKQPKACLELGCGMGYSSILFSYTLNDCIEIDTIERDQERINLAKQYLSLYGRENIHLFEGNTPFGRQGRLAFSVHSCHLPLLQQCTTRFWDVLIRRSSCPV